MAWVIESSHPDDATLYAKLPFHDAHCHLADLPDPDAALAGAASAGVGRVLAVSMAAEDGRRVLETARRHPGRVLPGLGLHPSRVASLSDARIDEEIAIVGERIHEACFVGEIGLDYKDARDHGSRRRQHDTLGRMLDLAASAGLPVNLHTRRADRDLLEVARRFTLSTGRPALLHWFTHSRKLAARCGEAGLYISVGPSILSDPDQADVARRVAEDLVLVETDAPVSFAGQPARPAWAARVTEALAAARGEDRERLADRLNANLDRYLSGVRPSAAAPSA